MLQPTLEAYQPTHVSSRVWIILAATTLRTGIDWMFFRLIWSGHGKTMIKCWICIHYLVILFEVPEGLHNGNNLLNTSIALESKAIEWRNFVSAMKNCITQKPKAKLSKIKHCFGVEWVSLHSQSFCQTLEIRSPLFGR